MGKRKLSALKRLTGASPGGGEAVKSTKKAKKGSSSSTTIADPVPELPPAVRQSDEAPKTTRPRWTNKQRVLIFSSRGISYRDRHLMNDFKTVMPHSKDENKMNKKEKLVAINEACEMKNCNLTLYFEARKKKDLYMWLAKTPDGPSAKFLVENIHTMDELKMTGNCLRGSRPILSFDKSFDALPHFSLLKELLAQTFNTPNHHPKSQPFVDRVMTFAVVDNRIWIRNFQIVEESGTLAEIGPRLTLNLIKIFEGSFRGECLFENSLYVSPNLHRRNVKLAAAGKYVHRIQTKVDRDQRKPETAYPLEDETDDIFRRAERFQRDGGDTAGTPPAKVQPIPPSKASKKQKNKKKRT
ncbi:Ribosome biogenesis protein BRX1-like protein [Hypsibius exemplaris]|uniref:Ribosome biogenesis protein BRX1 homolog n=1 Tax=Hypsibius exemplaris TaxID=2072580 RepID=A0A1W0WLB0_HYPEX|nr:Ribosome biogenesis protein BRX1-like protein [Hypsibius exemplaris]